MPKKSRFKIKNIAKFSILYDDHIVSDPTLALFGGNCDSPIPQTSLSENSGVGRAKVIYFLHDEQRLVLKHYYRGGLVASVLKDQYFGIDPEKTRAFKEWHLLKEMKQLGLPVPEAVAALAEKKFLYFRVDLITRELENTKTLADYLFDQAMDAESWKKIGVCIKLFHRHNVYHADLNARNILLAETGEVYLIDFDNSYFRHDSETWKMENVSRLKRSLLKFKKNSKNFYFDESDWSAFLSGYKLPG